MFACISNFTTDTYLINGKGDKDGLFYRILYPLRKYIGSQANFETLHVHVNDESLEPAINLTVASSQN